MVARTLVAALTVAALMTAVACGRPTTSSSTVAIPANVHFLAALADWRGAASTFAAAQRADWTRAASELQDGMTSDQRASTGEGWSAYASAIAQLTELTDMPGTGVTEAEHVLTHRDLTALDQFFGTPGLYP